MHQQSWCTAKHWEISSSPKLSQKCKHTLRKSSDTPTETTSFQFACRWRCLSKQFQVQEETSVRTIENVQRGGGDREVMKDIQDKQSKGTEYIGTKQNL